MKYLHTKKEHYRLFTESNSDRLDKNLKIITTSKENLLKQLSINEIFNKPLKTNYETERNGDNYKISFNTSKDEYRLDIFNIHEDDKGLVNHISFSSSNKNISDVEDYESPTNKFEMIEILNRIHFILNDLVSKKIIHNYFCVGNTEIESKNNIYEYFLKVVVGDDGFEKLNTKSYGDDNWGLYFKI